MSSVNPITKKSRRLSRGFSNAIVPLTKKKSTKDLSTGKTPPDGGGEKGQSSPPLKGNLIKHKMAKDFERLKELNSEVMEIIKYVQKYQAAIAEVAATGERIANIMVRVGETMPENEHANALKILGEKQASIETLRRNWESNLGNFVNTMRLQQENDRLRIAMLEKEMDKVNKGYDYQIKKMAEQTTKARKQGGDHMVKSMENLTEMVQEVDEKRGQMAMEVDHAICSEYCQWFSSWCLVMTTEGEFFRRSHELVQESSYTLSLAAQAPPPPPVTTWRSDMTNSLSPRGSPRKSPRKKKERELPTSTSGLGSPRWHHMTESAGSYTESDENNGGTSSSNEGGSGKEEKLDTPGRKKKKNEKKKRNKKKKGQLDEFKMRVEMDKATVLRESMMMRMEGRKKRRAKVEKVVALYDYQPEEEDELSFKVGDVIQLIQREGGGWWEGQMGDIRGFFPVNYVKEVIEVTSPDQEEESDKAISLSTDGDSDGSDSESESSWEANLSFHSAREREKDNPHVEEDRGRSQSYPHAMNSSGENEPVSPLGGGKTKEDSPSLHHSAEGMGRANHSSNHLSRFSNGKDPT